MSTTSTDQAVNQALREASAQLRSGAVDAALALLSRIDREYPDRPEVMRMRGIVLARIGRAAEAEPLLRAVADLAPGSPDAAADHAQSLLALGRADDALERLQAVAGPDEARPLAELGAVFAFNLGLALKATGQSAEAERPLSVVLAMQPGHYGALVALGDVLKALGRPEEAAGRYREAIAVQPEDGTAWWSLANLKSGGFSDAELRELRQRVRSVGRDPRQQAFFEFATATALDARDDTAEAFAHYQAGNRLKRGLEPWDRDAFGRWLQEMRDAMAGTPLATRPATRTGPRPVFIVSLPRSGSTLTEQVLAAHGDVTAAGELPWLPQLVADRSRSRGMGLARWAGAATDVDWSQLGQDYLHRCRRWHRTTPVFTDKLPGNLPYIGVILAMLPEAQVVAVRRDPMDACWSCYRQMFLGGSEFSYDLEDLAAYWSQSEMHVAHWASRAPDRVLVLDYEALVADSEAQIRGLLDFLDLPFDTRCLRPQDVDRAVATASASQVRQAIHGRGVGHWRRYRDHLGRLTDAFAR